VIWIVLFAGLLAGVVAVNVAVLRLNLALDGTSQERTQLKADIAGLRAGISSAAATSRIEQAARGELGLVEADPDSTVYVTLPAK
jgi:cell division protein FtsL